MRNLALALSVPSIMVTALPSFADLQVQFIEGAPKDRFVVTNVGDCDLGAGQFEIDFSASNGGLIFDVTGSGAGVEVFQPFEITSGAQLLAAEPSITDGDKRARLDILGLGVNETIAFTIDVDDTNNTREITVANGEIAGTKVSYSMADLTYSVAMEAQPQVVLSTPDCDANASPAE